MYSSSYRICSLHFEDSMYAGKSKKRLRSDAIPTLLLSMSTEIPDTVDDVQACNATENVPVYQGEKLSEKHLVEGPADDAVYTPLETPPLLLHMPDNATASTSQLTVTSPLGNVSPVTPEVMLVSPTTGSETDKRLSFHSPRKDRLRKKMRMLQKENQKLRHQLKEEQEKRNSIVDTLSNEDLKKNYPTQISTKIGCFCKSTIGIT